MSSHVAFFLENLAQKKRAHATTCVWHKNQTYTVASVNDMFLMRIFSLFWDSVDSGFAEMAYSHQS